MPQKSNHTLQAAEWRALYQPSEGSGTGKGSLCLFQQSDPGYAFCLGSLRGCLLWSGTELHCGTELIPLARASSSPSTQG